MNMPEKIYAVTTVNDEERGNWGLDPEIWVVDPVQYIRADRHEALLSALAELHGAVVDLPLKGHGPVAKAAQSAARILGEQA